MFFDILRNSSGKSTLCQFIAAEVQREGDVAAYIDMEHALDPVYAARCGVNIDDLLISQPDTGEQALEILETLVRSGAVGGGPRRLSSGIGSPCRD